MCIVGAIVCLSLGVPRSFLLNYLDGVILALLGALIASRQPRNSVGWLMIAFAWMASLFQVVAGYGYAALAVNHGAWPLGSLLAWMGAWIWAPAIGVIAPIAVRFPDGRRGRFGGFVDRLYVAGTALFALAIAFAAPPVELSYSALPGERLASELPYFSDPIALQVPSDVVHQVQGLAVTLVLLASILAVVSLILRYRGAHGDERLQIKWFAYAGALCAAAVVYGVLAGFVFGQALYLAFTPLELVALTIPAAIGIAILRYRLYDIDLIINRSVVYLSLTAILYAVYVAVTTLLQRLLISFSGQKTDAAYVLAAFVVVGAFNPIKDWLQRMVNRRLGRATASAALDQFSARVDGVVSVLDVRRIACQLVDEAVAAFDARGAALYMGSADGSDPFYGLGHLDGGAAVEVGLHHDGVQFGRLVLGTRRGDAAYTKHDVESLQRSADSVGEALALADHLGHGQMNAL
jgi:hypothetical protein